MLVGSPDREQRDLYELNIRVAMRKASEREVPVLFYTLYVNDKIQDTEGELVLSSFFLVCFTIRTSYVSLQIKASCLC